MLILIEITRLNVDVGEKQDKALATGLHTIADVSCQGCGTVLGWTYASLRIKYTFFKLYMLLTDVVFFVLSFSSKHMWNLKRTKKVPVPHFYMDMVAHYLPITLTLVGKYILEKELIVQV